MGDNNPENKTVVFHGGVFRVFYSMHSSLEELQDFVNCLKPRKITPIAKPDGVNLNEVKQTLIITL